MINVKYSCLLTNNYNANLRIWNIVLSISRDSIGTADGFPTKTDISKSFKHVTEGTDHADIPKDNTLVIEDGNALLHSMRDIPSNFKRISEKLFNMTPKKTDVIFSSDMYKQGSVNAMERKRCGCGEKHLVKGEKTGRLEEFPHKWREQAITCEDLGRAMNMQIN